jgi:hypothetical protein
VTPRPIGKCQNRTAWRSFVDDMKSDENKGFCGVSWRASIWALVLFKLWLVSAQTARIPGDWGHDQLLILRYANSIVQGDWLGPYWQMTLAREPMFALFLAATSILHIPLYLALAVVYAATCVLMIMALRPLMPCCGLRFGLFVVLLFNPITYDSEEYMYGNRQCLLPFLVMLILASLVAFYARREQPLNRQWPWGLGLGFALAAFWLTREESVWLLPAIVSAWLYLVWVIWRQPTGRRTARLFVVFVLPFLLWLAGLGAVGFLNWRHYGVFTTNERSHPSFKAAYGSLLRVKHEKEIPYVAMPRKTRMKVYQVSPAFNELRPFLEGPLGEAWARSSAHVTPSLAKPREIGGGWFVWAVRDAVYLSGHARTGTEAMIYYAQLAREVNEACDGGLLPAGPKHKGVFPPLRWAQIEEIGESIYTHLRYFFSFEGMKQANQPENPRTIRQRTPESVALFAKLTRERLSLPIQGAKNPEVRKSVNGIRIAVLEQIYRGYIQLMPWTSGAALMALMAASILALVCRQVPFFLVLTAGCLSSFVLLSVILSLVSVYWEPCAGTTTYYMGAYGMYLLCQFTSWLALAELLELKRKNANLNPSIDNQSNHFPTVPDGAQERYPLSRE